MKKPTTQTCPYCNGTGRDPQNSANACPVCHGKKKTSTTFER
jgi:DnaJ-class molecular chaperone